MALSVMFPLVMNFAGVQTVPNAEAEIVAVQDSFDWDFLPDPAVNFRLVVNVTNAGDNGVRVRLYSGTGTGFATGVLIATFDFLAIGKFNQQFGFQTKPAGVKKIFWTLQTITVGTEGNFTGLTAYAEVGNFPD